MFQQSPIWEERTSTCFVFALPKNNNLVFCRNFARVRRTRTVWAFLIFGRGQGKRKQQTHRTTRRQRPRSNKKDKHTICQMSKNQKQLELLAFNWYILTQENNNRESRNNKQTTSGKLKHNVWGWNHRFSFRDVLLIFSVSPSISLFYLFLAFFLPRTQHICKSKI